MTEVVIDTGYRPRKHQRELHKKISKHRFAIVVAHRRFGKTVCAVNHLIDAALQCQRERPRFAYIAPYRNQAKSIAWDYLKAFSHSIPDSSFNESELRVDFGWNGSRITLFGADNANALRGQYFDGVFFDEFSQIAPSVFSEIVRPALSDRLGWCVFGGTPMGRNHFHELIELAKGREDWAVSIYRASDTGVIAESELKAALLEMGQERYDQEFECSFDAAIQGAYYADYIKTAEQQGRLCEIATDGALRVNTAWDLGVGDDTAIWFFQESPGGQIRLIDYYENHGVGLDHYVRVIDEKSRANGWLLGEHFLPHDVEVRELGSGRSRFETLSGLGIRPTIVKRMSVDDGINAVRVAFPRLWFNVPTVQRGLDALRQYRREYDEKRQVFYDKPLHDWTSHACLDGDSIVKTARGDIPIRDVVVGDYAWTPAGYALVSASGPVKVADSLIELTLSDGRTLLCTPEHKIFTTSGVFTADALRYEDGVFDEEEMPCLSYQRIKSVGYRDAFIESFNARSIGSGLIENSMRHKLVGGFACFIVKCTKQFTEYCREVLERSTETCATQTQVTGLSNGGLRIGSIQFKRLMAFGSITNRKAITRRITSDTRASQCTDMSGRSTTAKSQKAFTFTTKTATRLTTTFPILSCFAQLNTFLNTPKKVVGLAAKQTLNNLGRLARRLRLGTLHRKGLLGTAKMGNGLGNTSLGLVEIVTSAEGSTSHHTQTDQSSVTKIVRLRRLEGAEACRLVYDLTVEKHHCYLANGLLVSNSDAIRYLCSGLREASSSAPIRRGLRGII